GVLVLSSIKVGASAADKWEAIAEAGSLLVKGGYVAMDYVDAMVEREKLTTTYLGMGIAIPHGTQSAKREVHRTGISVVQYPEGVDFDGEKAYLVIGIAGVGDEHLELLARVSEALDDEQVLERLKSTNDPMDIYNVLNA
ncbi:MAG: PTS sugar transporter subunit IIA, partial [Alistipes sp.]|nr:PTS sugar transporter subunit IIA [Alistipes sp.]